MVKPLAEFVVYKGEEVVAVGTLRQCAEKLGTKQSVIQCAANPARIARADATPGSKQLVAIRV